MSKLRTEVKKFRRIIYILVVVIVVLGFIFLSQQNRQIELPKNIEIAEIRDVERIISIEGNIVGKDEREVYLATGSKLTDLRVSLSSSVDKDAILAVIETTNNIGNKVNQEIRSPIKGTVTEINFKQGDQIFNTIYGFKIVDNSEYKIKSQANEVDVIYLKKGQSTKIIIPAISLDKRYDGQLSLLGATPIANSTVVNYPVEVTLTGLEDNVRLGMSADLEILTDKVEDVLAIPESYLVEKDDKFYVKVIQWKDSDKRSYEIVEIEVEVGLLTDQYIEIKKGISRGTEIVEPEFSVSSGFGFF